MKKDEETDIWPGRKAAEERMNIEHRTSNHAKAWNIEWKKIKKNTYDLEERLPKKGWTLNIERPTSNIEWKKMKKQTYDLEEMKRGT